MGDGEPASAASMAIAAGILGLLTGYFVGQGRSLGLFGGASATRTPPQSRNSKASIQESASEASDTGDETGSPPDLQSFVGNSEECKLVLVVRTDLGMGKGKIAAQCSHATLACYKAFLHTASDSSILKRWERLGQAKVALQVKTEDEMLMLQAQAISLGLCAHVIHDAGRTQIASGSATVLGIGPAPKSKIDEVTGHLKLL